MSVKGVVSNTATDVVTGVSSDDADTPSETGLMLDAVGDFMIFADGSFAEHTS